MEYEKLTVLEIWKSLTLGQAWKIMTFFAALISLTFYASSLIQKQAFEKELSKISDELRKCELKWEEVKPYIDVRSVFDLKRIIVPEVVHDVPPGSQELGQGIVAVENVGEFKYKKIPLREYREKYANTAFSVMNDPFIDDTDVLVWSSGEEYRLSEGQKSFTKTPHIMIYKIGIPVLRNKLVQTMNSMIKGPGFQRFAKAACDYPDEACVKTDAALAVFIRLADSLERIDIPTLGYVYLQLGNILMLMTDPSFDWRVLSMEKDANILNFQNLYIYRNKSLSFKGATSKPDKFFVKEQVLLLIHGQNVYYVRIDIPASDIKSIERYKPMINQWVSSLRLYKEL